MPATQTVTKWKKTKANGKSKGTKVRRKLKQVAKPAKRSTSKKSASARKPAPKKKSR